jgi:hypothetical protein
MTLPPITPEGKLVRRFKTTFLRTDPVKVKQLACHSWTYPAEPGLKPHASLSCEPISSVHCNRRRHTASLQPLAWPREL